MEEMIVSGELLAHSKVILFFLIGSYLQNSTNNTKTKTYNVIQLDNMGNTNGKQNQ